MPKAGNREHQQRAAGGLANKINNKGGTIISGSNGRIGRSTTTSTVRIVLLLLIAFGSFLAGRISSHSDLIRSSSSISLLSQEDLFGFAPSATGRSTAAGIQHISSNNPHGLALIETTHNRLLFDAPYTLNDRSLHLSPYVDYRWLHNGDFLPAPSTPNTYDRKHKIAKQVQPELKIVLTDFGWNQADPVEGLKFPRTLRSRELVQGIVHHSHFDPTFQWSRDSHNLTSFEHEEQIPVQLVVFLDVETCMESNYPFYSKGSAANQDVAHKRETYGGGSQNLCPNMSNKACPYIDRVLKSPLFVALGTDAKLIVIECRGDGPEPQFRQSNQTSSQLSLATVSSTPSQLQRHSDMGLPPPAVNPARLTHAQRSKILSCDGEEDDTEFGSGHRFNYYLTCVASLQRGLTPTRRALYRALHNPAEGRILMQPGPFRNQYPHLDYHNILQESIFSATPLGNNLFSYRFTEVLSAGAIPVLLADGWVLPFHPLLVDWNECLVLVPETRVNETLSILQAISPQKRCQMRRTCYDIYTRYMANPEGTIRGLVDIAQRMMTNDNPQTKAKDRFTENGRFSV